MTPAKTCAVCGVEMGNTPRAVCEPCTEREKENREEENARWLEETEAGDF